VLHGRNSLGNVGYDGPLGTLGTLGRTIRYRLRLIALDQALDLAPGLDKPAFLEAASGHVLEEDDLTVSYERRP
jgi:phosphatidylethanolamine-binding protein (PEBP) family uncharacterized protein